MHCIDNPFEYQTYIEGPGHSKLGEKKMSMVLRKFCFLELEKPSFIFAVYALENFSWIKNAPVCTILTLNNIEQSMPSTHYTQ